MDFKVNDRRRFNMDGTSKDSEQDIPERGMDVSMKPKTFMAPPKDPLCALTDAIEHLIANDGTAESMNRMLRSFYDWKAWQTHVHQCERPDAKMDAVDDVSIEPNGSMVIGNSEYGADANFCPWCGYRAHTSIEAKYARRTP